MTTRESIAAAYRMARAMLHRFVDDLEPNEFLAPPMPRANNAEWIVGHLALTVRTTAIRLGAEDLPGVSPAIELKYSKTGKPAEVSQFSLATAEELLKLFDTCIDGLVERILQLPEAKLSDAPASPSPFATNFGEGLLFGAMHIAMHAGQLSTIRRALGKPPIV